MRKLRRLVVLLCVLALPGCGMPTTGEQFLQGGSQNSDQYENLASAVLSDGQLTDVELEQVYASLIQCYAEQGLAGEYAYDVKANAWVLAGYGLSRSHPEYTQMNDESSKEEQQAYKRATQALEKASSTCDGHFQKVQDLRLASVDFQALASREYDNMCRCLANAKTDIADAIDSAWGHDEDGLSSLYGLIDETLAAGDLPDSQLDAIGKCAQWAGNVPHAFGDAG